MLCQHCTGPHRAIVADDHSGYTTIHDAAGRMIGAATSGNRLARKTVMANGRLFAAAATLHSALTRYFHATDADFVNDLTPEVLETLNAARQEALAAFAIVEGIESAASSNSPNVCDICNAPIPATADLCVSCQNGDAS